MLKDDKKNKPARVSFEMWFNAQNKPAHHKRGMMAYSDTKGKKTAEKWSKIFKNY